MQLENTEDFYPLSPLQEGMLFHALYSPEGGEYISQILCTMRGDFNVTAFKQALLRVVQRHAALRTFFIWEGLKEPVQVVQKHLDLTWDDLDWRGLSPEAHFDQLRAYIVKEQTRGFDLSRAPLMRLALIRMSDDEYQFVWTYHHILLDGWSGTLVSRDIISFYRALSRGDDLQLPKPYPYRDYIAWLQQQDLGSAEKYWREALKGFTTATPLIPNNVPGPTLQQQAYYARPISFSRDETVRLQDAARKHRVTLNTLVQGAWALVLSRYSGQQDVVFGATVSGRPPELKGVEEMVGIFINTLPVRVRVAPEMPIADWLWRLQKEQLESHQYEYSSLTRVQGWSEVKRGSPLFQSIVVFENFPGTTSSSSLPANQGGPGGGEIRYRILVRESYPLTLAADPGPQLLLEIKYDTSLFYAANIRHLSKHLETFINALSQSNVWQQTLGELLERTHVEQQVNEERKVKEVRSQLLKQVKRKVVTGAG